MIELTARRLVLLVIVLALVVPSAGADSRDPNPPSVTLFSKVHHLDWSRVSPEEIERLSGMVWKRRVLRSPVVSATCAENIYLSFDSKDGVVTLEFTSAPQPDGCRVTLYAATFETTASHADAQLRRSDFIEQLKPGGDDGCDVDVSAYTWRSRDSRTRFHLQVAVKTQTEDATPSTAASLIVRLSHTAVDRLEVDHLPFEKGVFLDTTSAPAP